LEFQEDEVIGDSKAMVLLVAIAPSRVRPLSGMFGCLLA